MILSVSRRTDIPNYYSDWFYNRIIEKYVLVRNPMNIHQISRINLSPDVVDCIVFWTKNPQNMFKRINEIKDYNYYFQFTLNSYGKDIEPNVPSKNKEVIDAFKELSTLIGKERVIWRYDPILINSKYTPEYHYEYFDKLSDKLRDYTDVCTISFIDLYKNIKKNSDLLGLKPLNDEMMFELSKNISLIAKEKKLKINSCAEDIDLDKFGIKHASCIDKDLIEKIIGCKLNIKKDKNQRQECGCVESIDIGMYNTCKNECKYCYANFSLKTVYHNYQSHDPNSPLLFGHISEADTVKIRDVKSSKDFQVNLFEL